MTLATQLTTTTETPRMPALPQSPEAERFGLMQRQARLFAQSPLIPQHLRNGGPDQAMANCYIAMTIADKMGEDRMTVMQNIHIVHGTAGFKASYMIARANASGKFKDTIDWEVSGKGDDLSVTAFATLASTGRRVEFTVTMAMAKDEGWTKNSKYKTLPELMLRYRSGTFLVRLYAPEVMLGYQTAEEVEDVGFAATTETVPLTGQMLIEQAKPTETVDQATGEVTEEPHPARGKADAIIAEFEAAQTIIDLNSAKARADRDTPAMPDDIAAAVQSAFDREKERLGGKVTEGAE